MEKNVVAIREAAARENVHLTLESGQVLSGPIGEKLETYLQQAKELGWITSQAPLIAAVVDGKLRELTYPINQDVTVRPVTLKESDGGRIYRRSLVLLMTTAVDELWSGTQVNVNYAVYDGGFFCEVVNRDPLTDSDIAELEQKMCDIVAEDNPIGKRMVSLEEARQLFAQRGDNDKVRLLEARTRDNLTLYSLRERDDYYFGYMVPSTRYLQTFRLMKVDGGFILQYPRRETPTELHDLHLHEKLHTVFHQADDWLAKLQIEDIGRLNHLVRHNRIDEIILVAEALHEQNVAAIAAQIRQQHENGVRIILIAGPSSAGKTTFSKRLAIQLLANGLRPYTIEMDNYFVDRERTPRDENGDYDFESLYALDREKLNQHLLHLMAGERVQLPKFSFQLGKSEPGRWAQLLDRQIVILEGIHGMNPELLPELPTSSVFRVYVSVMSQLNIDSHNRIPTTDVRLLRRLVRDARSRGYNAIDTLSRWQSVRRGEKRNIFPYQENADVMFNSALPYELAALRSLAEPLLLQVPTSTPPHIEANRLLSFLRWVEPLTPQQTTMIPDTSLLREFIGGSILDSYHPSEAGEE
ncbi:MAG: nucleoside kinase [Anaerolineae bacterium]|nr:nucleoside kinase [Anaerolineae bacterium]MDQ7033512.1 nucleoside kinase [Anaerolineae bacterium]